MHKFKRGQLVKHKNTYEVLMINAVESEEDNCDERYVIPAKYKAVVLQGVTTSCIGDIITISEEFIIAEDDRVILDPKDLTFIPGKVVKNKVTGAYAMVACSKYGEIFRGINLSIKNCGEIVGAAYDLKKEEWEIAEKGKQFND